MAELKGPCLEAAVVFFVKALVLLGTCVSVRVSRHYSGSDVWTSMILLVLSERFPSRVLTEVQT